MHITAHDLHRPDVVALLEAHVQSATKYSPPESIHALDWQALRGPDIIFWTMRLGEHGNTSDELMGCAALKTLSATRGEVKSMRTVSAHLRKGVGAQLLAHLIDTARDRGMTWLGLETGAMTGYAPARALYERNGFTHCPAFGVYRNDEFSLCMSRGI